MNTTTRRNFLKVGAALPLALHALDLRANEGKKTPPKRIIFICNSLGFVGPNFFPETRGNLETSTYLKDFRTRNKMSVLQNLFHPGMSTGNHDTEKTLLTGAPWPSSFSFSNTVSVDQVIAKHIGNETRFPSLPMSIYDRGWGCSWNARGIAIPPMHDTTLIFNKLFGKENLQARKQKIASEKNILACLLRDAGTLRKNGGDAGMLDTYSAAASELEAQLAHDAVWLSAKKPTVVNSLDLGKEYAFSAKVHNLLELAKWAFQTDSTRVITITLDWIEGAIKVPGAEGNWHSLSHHGNNPNKLNPLAKVETNILTHLDQFLFDLDQIRDGHGTLLDHTTVVIGSNFGDASNHTCNNLPIIVAGGGFRHQQHLALDKPTKLCNLYLELLHTFNIDAGRFGNSEKDMGLLNGYEQTS